MHSPTIAQQRTVLVALVALIGAAVSWQNVGGGVDYPVRKFAQTPTPDVSEIDFNNAEAAWRDLQIDSHGNLQMDALTESALLDAMAFLDDQRAEASMTRMAFLLEKQLGATASRQIMELLPRLRRYKEAEQLWWTQNGSRNPPPLAELFELQDELLGKAQAQALFSEQRRLVELMLASQQIRNDANLTPEQRDQALMQLQKSTHQEQAYSE